VFEEVLWFEHLPGGSPASRRVVMRSSDGSDGELRQHSDEVMFTEGDLLGETCEQLWL
jgi:hypothetical protein